MTQQTTFDLIIEKADQLFYQQGFNHTSFAHIAQAVNISRGNFYHHFKSKDEILQTVIAYRIRNTQLLLAQWEQEGETPAERIHSFINILIMNQSKITRYGCPVGTLCSELVKLNHKLQDNANELFTLFRNWLRKQFELLGHPKTADDLAMHLLARSQGIATLASAFHDAGFIDQEVQQLNEWLAKYNQ